MKKKIKIILILAIILTAATVSITFGLMLVLNSPSPRAAYKMVYDESINKVVLFGGGHQEGSTYTYYGDTWIYDPVTNLWTEIQTSNQPSARSSHSMVYDPENRKIILFGGIDQSGTWLSDTWIFDSTTNRWIEVFPDVQPPGRGSTSIYYDKLAQKVILFGGYRELSGHHGDTWAYDYSTNNWTNLNPSVAPTERYGAPMVYDPINERGFMFGGRTTSITDECWVYYSSNNTWAEINTVVRPPNRYWEGLAYDSDEQQVIMFGGRGTGGVGDGLDDTWIYDPPTNAWTQVFSSSHPSHRFHFCLVYDPQSKKTLLFGGFRFTDVNFGDTWAFNYGSNNWNLLK